MLSVVLPAYNEAPFLPTTIDDLRAGLAPRGEEYELIIVENGSKDDTRAVAADLERRFPEVRALTHPEPDYGRALRAGFLAARGEIVVNFDVDFYDVAFLDQAVALIRQPGGPDVVVASKRSDESVDTRALPRRIVTAVFSSTLKYGFGLKVSDTHGMKAMRREPLRPLAERCQLGTDLFDTELVLRAERAGYHSAEIPVVVQEKRPARTAMLPRIVRSVGGLGKLWRVLHNDAPRRAAS